MRRRIPAIRNSLIYFKGMGMNGDGAHDPFRIIVKGCLAEQGIQLDIEEDRIFNHSDECRFDCICIEPDEAVISALTSFKSHVRKLRQLYRAENVCINYADDNLRRAYMLAYYSYYINPICQTLDNCKFNDIAGHTDILSICCFGGGPLPELIGIAKYVNSSMPKTVMIDCTVFDYYDQWAKERNLHTQNLVGHYYDGLINLHEQFINLWSEQREAPVEIENAELVVFQNCFNDCPKEKHEILKNNVFSIWQKMPIKSLMIIIDLTFGSKIELMRQIEALITRCGGNIIIPVGRNEAPLKNCALLAAWLYDGSDGLIAKSSCRYWRLAMQKK